jgi:putative ABC transport system ATP-binding protein
VPYEVSNSADRRIDSHFGGRSPSSDSPVISLRAVGRVFPSGEATIAALNNVSIDVPHGDWLAIMGPSGSGKTTLLNLISGLDKPTSGTVTVFDQPLQLLKESELTTFRARHLGLVFQDHYLLPGLSALDNVILARLPWSNYRQLEPRARTLLSEVGLQARVNFPPARLSSGECQRVSIARALIGDPKLLLTDEPTGRLDARTTTDVLGLLEELRVAKSLTIVTVTHDPNVAARASRVLNLKGGEVVNIEQRS